MTGPQSEKSGGTNFWVRASLGVGATAALAAWAVSSLDVDAIQHALARIDTLPVLGAMAVLVLAVWLLRALRWHLILKSLGATPTFWDTYLSTSVSLGLASVTPLQVGEALKISHARSSHGINLASGTGAYAVERLADVAVVLGLTALCSSQLILPNWGFAALGIGIVLAVLAAAILLYRARQSSIGCLANELIRGVRILMERPKLQIAVWILTVGVWLLTAVLWRYALDSAGVHTSLAASMLLVGTVTLASVALFVPGALGVSEVTVTALLVQQGFTAENGLAGALVLRLITLIAIALGALHWLLLKTNRSGSRQ